MFCGGQAHALHSLIGIALSLKAGGEQFVLGIDAIPFCQLFSVIGKIYVTGHEVVAVEVLRQIQGVIQAVAVLQFHNRHKFIRPSGFSLALFAPDVTKVDGMADKFRCRAILGENVLQLREAAVHIHGDALGQGFDLQCGQRQALTLLMASLVKPKLLLLDEHTAALDPKTAAKVLSATETIVGRDHLTTLMITHNMRDTIAHGNRLIMMYEGRVALDIAGEEKKKVTVEDLLAKFGQATGSDEADDKLLLG